VLHVEDSVPDAELVASALEQEELVFELTRVDSLADVEQALSATRFDVILSDYNLHSFNGLDVLGLSRRMAPGVPFLLVTGTLGEERAVEALRAGATDYVLKHRLDRLGQAVRRAVKEARTRQEREAALEAVARSEGELRAMFDSAPVGMVAVDADLRIISCNRSFCDMLRYTDSELVGRSVLEVTHPDDLDLSRRYAVRVFGGEPVGGEEKRYIRKDGSVMWARRHASLVKDPSGKVLYALGTIEDITGRKELEQQLQQAQKMEILGQFTGGIAHDFNNVLSVVMASCELVKGAIGADRPELAADLEQSLAAARTGRELIRKLMAFSRREALELEVLDLGRLVKDLARTMRRILPANIVVDLSAAVDLPPVHADDVALSQVMMNLATNARDAMAEGGRFEVAVTAEPVSAERGRLHGVPEGEYLRIAARDTGCGMNEETRRRIFEPLFTTKPSGRGTGLGMSMVFGIVRQHGGFVEVWSSPGEGTRVDIYLPAAVGAEVRPAARRTSGERAAASGAVGETILIVDDEPVLRRSTARVLSRLGYRVLEAEEGRDALEKVRGEPVIGLVITDYHMPRMGGRELVAALRQLRPSVRIIVTTGDDVDWGEEQGVAWLAKPWTVEELRRTVRACLDQPGTAAPGSVDSLPTRP
jgi:PAS domain S-box-containing protein